MKQVKTTPNLFSASVLVFAAILVFTGCKKGNEPPRLPWEKGAKIPSKDYATVATDWYKMQLRMILRANPAAPNFAVTRLFAYSGISLFESARFENDDLKSLQSELNQMPVMPLPKRGLKYSWVVAANAALANITRDLFPVLNSANNASIDSLEKIYHDKFIGTVGSDIVSRSETFGDSIASEIFDWAKSDLANHANDAYTPPVFPGAWVRTPPAFAAPATPYAGNCRTFMREFSQVTAPPPPFSYSEEASSDFYKMVNNIYVISKSLTADQKNIALFWNDVGAGIGYTPMGHTISIVTQILDNRNASLATAAIAYAKTGIALWDALVVCFRSKYKYNQLRPVTYIRQQIDTAWLPLIATPPHPEYPAAHAFLTSSVMEVLESVFGRQYNFTDHTYDFRNLPPRSYTSFEQIANECGQSRVFGGIHYQPSVDAGHIAGKTIGNASASIDIGQKN
jgi:PAP2 superfamily